MPIQIGNNPESLAAQRYLGFNQNNLVKHLQRLSSGSRLGAIGDDPAVIGIAQSLFSQINSTAQAERNVNDGISLTQTADGALSGIGDTLSRMRELSVEAANGTLDANARASINTEFKQLSSEIDQIAGGTDFNGQKLLNGSMASGVSLQVGVNNTANDQTNLAIADTRTTALGGGGGGQTLNQASADTVTNAQNALATIDQALSQISSRRADVGITQNRLITSQANLQNIRYTTSDAYQRIHDVDVAAETANLTGSQILNQASLSILAQANGLGRNALRLLGV